MFIVLLKFSDNKADAKKHMDGHNAWVKRGIDDGVFCLVGSLQPNQGGAILAHGVTREALEARTAEDPFVVEDVVSVEILDITPAKVDERLAFLMD